MTDTAQVFRVEVRSNCDQQRSAGRSVVDTARQIGIDSLIACQELQLYFLGGQISPRDARRLSDLLLHDPVTEAYEILVVAPGEATTSSYVESVAVDHIVEVAPLPGVTDPPAENLARAARLAGIPGLEQAATGRCYLVWGAPTQAELQRLAVEALSNPVIQRYSIDRPIEPPFVPVQHVDDTVDVIPVQNADEQMLAQISADRRLALDVREMVAIRDYFTDEERDPTDVELEMLAQTWSEHCVHKTFKALIEDHPRKINGLLHTCIRAATEEINKPWVRSAFVDNAGIVAFDDHHDLAFKVETHNHPSALEPFGGANTGIGGVVRDILGVSARPIANTDVLCFGPQDLPRLELPAGVLHPRRVAAGVVHGVEDYGNKMGIPTVNGAVVYHPGYTANPLVFCGCLGIVPRGAHPSSPEPGDLIVVVGGRTGRDGLRGATFSSMEMDQATGAIAGSAVQIGHPIHEKQVQEVVLRARDERLYSAITDCGAGGLSSAIGEMARDVGASVQLDAVPLKYPGLRPWEIWLSEAQERMVLAVPLAAWPRLKAICDGQDIEAVRIGQFESTERIRLFFGGKTVGDISMDFLHGGIPRRRLKATWDQPAAADADAGAPAGEWLKAGAGAATLLALLASPNIRSKESIVRRYDHEVQGAVAVKPFTGAADHGPSDAAVLAPAGGEDGRPLRGVALSAGICPQYTELDPYAMAWAAIDEAMRNAVAVGADPDQVALLDNFCWGNPSLPDRLGSLVRCAQGCYDAAIAYQAPFISGKDSLNNEYLGADGRKHAIPGTLLISGLGIVPDVRRACTMDFKQPGNRIYIVGDTRVELGGSACLQAIAGGPGAGATLRPPQPVPGALDRLRALHRAMAAGLVQACHDCSEGGLGVAVAEMCLAGRLGAQLALDRAPGAGSIEPDAAVLYSESLCRFVVEVRPDDAAAFQAVMRDAPCACAGEVIADDSLSITGRGGAGILRAGIDELERAWRGEETGVRSEEREKAAPLTPHSSPLPPVSSSPRVLILHANGANRDRDAALACEMAGGAPEIVHVNQLLSGERRLADYGMLVIPGGFSYGDDLGAGTLWAFDIGHRLREDVARFVEAGRPVLGICNGFQALVKSGLLPGGPREVTLAQNELQRFECRWVYLRPNPASRCLFVRDMADMVYCPVAHGEGRVTAVNFAALDRLRDGGLIALTYADARGEPVGYPGNPNGSVLGIAGLTNAAGNVLGLMPHPENHIFDWQHPRWRRGERGMSGLALFRNAIRAAAR